MKNQSENKSILITNEQIESLGYVIYFNHKSFFIAVDRLHGNDYRIIKGDLDDVFDSWYYNHPAKALIGLCLWSVKIQREPEGWYRHPSSGRRRPNGDSSRQYIQK